MSPEQNGKAVTQPVSSPATSQTAGANVLQGGIPSNAVSTPRAEELVKRMGTTGSQDNVADATTVPSIDPSDLGYDPRMIEQIKDPFAKDVVMKMKEEMTKGLNRNMQRVSNERKEVEQLKKELEAKTNQPWTPERVQQLLRDPNFAQSAASLQQTQPPADWSGSNEEWSTLTPNEKRQFSELRSEVTKLRLDQNRQLISSEEAKIKAKYPDYDPNNVERWYKDAAEGRIPEGQIRELIHKALNFEKYVEGGYKFGLEDRNVMLREKSQGMSTNGVTTQTTADVPKRVEGETSRSLFSKLARMRLSSQK